MHAYSHTHSLVQMLTHSHVCTCLHTHTRPRTCEQGLEFTDLMKLRRVPRKNTGLLPSILTAPPSNMGNGGGGGGGAATGTASGTAKGAKPAAANQVGAWSYLHSRILCEASRSALMLCKSEWGCAPGMAGVAQPGQGAAQRAPLCSPPAWPCTQPHPSAPAPRPAPVHAQDNGGEAFISRLTSGMTFDFSARDERVYIVGTEDGWVHRCSTSYNEQVCAPWPQRQAGHACCQSAPGGGGCDAPRQGPTCGRYTQLLLLSLSTGRRDWSHAPPHL